MTPDTSSRTPEQLLMHPLSYRKRLRSAEKWTSVSPWAAGHAVTICTVGAEDEKKMAKPPFAYWVGWSRMTLSTPR